MKLFLALDCHHAQLDLKKLKVSLHKSKNLDYQWVKEGQRHINLLTLGNIPEEKYHAIHSILQHSLEHYPALELKLEGVWAFPNQDRGRLLWVGVQNSRELKTLQLHLINRLHLENSLNFQQLVGPIKPHMTIVRFRNYHELSDQISPYKNTSFGKITISNLVVYEMTFGGAFPIYRKLTIYPLKSQPTLSDSFALT